YAASVILISSNSSDDSVGSHGMRMILFSAIPAIIPVILVVPIEVPIVPLDPLVASEVGAVSFTLPAEVLDLVDYSSSFDSDPLEDSLLLALELPLVSPFLCFNDLEADGESERHPHRRDHHLKTPVHHHMSFPLPLFCPTQDSSTAMILIRPDEAILFGRPYCTHPNGPHSLSDTSSVHSSGYDASGQSHSGPLTRVASPRSPTTLVPSSTPVSRSIAPTISDLLPPRKRFRDSYSPEDSREEHIQIDTADAKAVADLAPVIPISSDSSAESVGSHVPRVILFGAIPAIIHVIPKVPVEVPIVPSPTLC
nr:hypothetical protein [Tanacetum cinerariifolium]